jgi:hypothetical protein
VIIKKVKEFKIRNSNEIKKSGINWYDLRDNYSIVKEYINVKLSSFDN